MKTWGTENIAQNGSLSILELRQVLFRLLLYLRICPLIVE